MFTSTSLRIASQRNTVLDGYVAMLRPLVMLTYTRNQIMSHLRATILLKFVCWKFTWDHLPEGLTTLHSLLGF